MNCLEWNQLLDMYIDGELNDAQRSQFEAHVRECEQCREALKAAEQLRDILSQMDDEIDVPLKAQAAWRNAIRAEAHKKKVRRIVRTCSAAAAVCVLTVGVTAMFRNPPKEAEPMVARVAADGMDGGETMTAQTLRMRQDDEGRPVALERIIYVEDVKQAEKYLRDVVEEYEAEVTFESELPDRKNIFVDVAGENAADFLSAAEGIGTRTDDAVLNLNASQPKIELCIALVAE